VGVTCSRPGSRPCVAVAGPAVPTTVTPLRNGPLLLSGELEVTRPDGTVETTPRATLCRCGLSANKPFCDNSHLRSDFTAPGDRLRIPASPVRKSPNQPIASSEDPRE
jgi:CDGSH-type Zn-finger protein